MSDPNKGHNWLIDVLYLSISRSYLLHFFPHESLVLCPLKSICI